MYGGCWVEKGWERGGGEKRGTRFTEENRSGERKGRKDRILSGEAEGGRILKRVKRAVAKQRESKAAVE